MSLANLHSPLLSCHHADAIDSARLNDEAASMALNETLQDHRTWVEQQKVAARMRGLNARASYILGGAQLTVREARTSISSMSWERHDFATAPSPTPLRLSPPTVAVDCLS